MQFKLTINCDNAAFGEDDEQDARLDEVARSLDDVTMRLREGTESGTVRDINGNTVGRFELVED